MSLLLLGQQNTLAQQVAALFPDVWYDPSDLTTLYQDAAGTTPVTAVEQPVGLMLDKSRGLVLGSERVTNGNFSNGTTGWIADSGCTLSASGGVLTATTTADDAFATQQNSVYATNKAYRVTFTYKVNNTTTARLRSGGTVLWSETGSLVNKTVTAIVFPTTTQFEFGVSGGTVTAFEISNISVRELPGNHCFHTPGDTTTRPVYSRRINAFVGTETLATQNVTTLATSYVLSFTGTGSLTLSGTATGTYSAGTNTITCTAGTLTATVSGTVTKASLVPADLAALPYQRVNTATDYDANPALFPAYLRCDGTNDGMQTNAIDFTGTNKMFVSAGVRKLSDAAGAVFAELSSTFANSGSFGVFAPDSATVGNYAFGSRGTSPASAAKAGYAAPITNVLSGIGDISGDSAILRVNGAQAASNANDQGTGNYGNYPLYLFRRGGSTLPFNGWFYGLQIKGATLTAAQIAIVERYNASKTKTVVLA